MDSPTEDNNQIMRDKIKSLNDQIKLRLSVPLNLRTDKQAVKLDNLCYELNCLIDEYHKNEQKVHIDKN